MSTSIDNRVVGLQFDNKNFEKNVGRTLNSLDKLENSLQLKGAGRGLEELDKAASRMDFSKMGRATELITKRLSTMGIVGMNVLNRIANKAITTGEQMIRAFTFQPIHDGFSEYELKMGSVQTIVASTGESLDTVNGYLEELNRYSDKTIYSFKDMTSNIGKFTNAGIKLEDAVLAIQGISNEAAVSGANAEEASRAMYNFSQALSSGYVKLIDWKSIENANMATREFKQELINTAVAMGTLTDAGNGMYKAGNVAMNATQNFNDSLQKQWMTSEVLIETLRRYSDETTTIGKKAFAAAQDIKTYHQLIDTVKESIGSGWAQISEIVFGDLDEAKKLWTSLGNTISNFVDNTFGNITSFLKNNLQSNYKKFMSEGPITDMKKFNDDYQTAVDERNKIAQKEFDDNNKVIQSREASLKEWDKYNQRLKEKENNGGWYINDAGDQQWYLEEPKAIEATADEVAKLTKRNEELGKQLNDNTIKADLFKDTLIKQFDDANSRMHELFDAGYTYEEALKAMEVSDEEYRKMMAWRRDIQSGKIDVDALVASFDEVSRREKIFKSFGNVFKAFGAVVSPVTKAFKNIFFNADKDELWLGKLVDNFEKFTAKLIPTEEWTNKVTSAFERMFGWVHKLGDWAIPKLKSGFKKVSGFLEASAISTYHFISSLIDYIDPIQMLTDAYEWCGKVVDDLTDSWKKFIDKLEKDPDVGPVVTAFEKVQQKFEDILNNPVVTKEGKVLTKGYEKFAYALKDLPEIFKEAFADVEINFDEFVDKVKEKSREIKNESDGTFSEAYNNLKDFCKNAIDTLKNFGKAVIDNLGFIVSGAYVVVVSYGILRFVAFIDKIAGLVQDFIKNIKNIPKAFADGMKRIAKAVSFEHRAKGIKAFADAILSIAIAVGILAAAIWGLTKIEDPDKLAESIAIVSGLIIALGILGYAVSRMGDIKSAALLGSIAVAILSVAGAAYILSKVNFDGTSDETWGALIAIIGVVTIIVYAMSKLDKVMGKTNMAKTVIAVFSAIGALYFVIRLISKIDNITLKNPNDFGQKLISLLAIIGYLLTALRLSGANAGKAGVGLLALSVSLYLFVGLIDVMKKVQPEDVLITFAKLLPLFALINLFLLATQKAGANAHKAAASILAIGLAMIPLGALFVVFGKLKIGEIGKGLFAMIPIMVALGVVLAMARNFNASFKSMIGLVAVISALGIVIGGLAVVAHFSGWQSVLTATAAMVTTIGALSLMMFILSRTNNMKSGKMLIQMGAMLAVAELLTLIIIQLTNTPDPKKAVTMAIVFGSLLAELTLVALAMAAIGSFAVPAAEGIAVLLALIASIAGLLALFSAMEGDTAAASTFLTNGIPVLQAIGEGLGAFFGGIQAGFTSAIVDGLVSASESLISFMENIKTAAAIDIPDGFGDTLASVAIGIAAITATDIIDGVGNWLGLTGNISSMTEDLKSLGTGLKEMSDELGPDVDLDVIDTAAKACSAIGDMALKIPSDDGGILGKLFGKKSLATFSSQFSYFGSALKLLSENASGIVYDNIKKAADSGTLISDMAKGLPNSGGLMGRIFGDNDLDAFSSQFEAFGTSLKTLSENAGGVIVDNIKKAADSGTMLANMASEVPNGGGKIAEWFGDNDLTTFGTSVTNFVDSLVDISGKTIDSEVIDDITVVGTKLATMAETIPGMGGIWQEIWGTSTPEDFGKQLELFVASLAMVDDYVIKVSTFIAVNTATQKLKAVSDNIKNSDTSGFEDFQNTIQSYVNWIKDLNTDGVDEAVQSVSTVAKSMLDALLSYNSEYSRRGRLSMFYFISGIRSKMYDAQSVAHNVANVAVGALNVYGSAYNAGDNFTQGFIDGMNNKKGGVYNAAYEIGRQAVDGIHKGTDEASPSKLARKAGQFVDEGFILGLNDYSNEVYTASEDVGSASMQAITDAIAGISRVINSDIDLQPTIRPVLDLSDIHEGAKELDSIYDGRKVQAISAGRRVVDSSKYDHTEANAVAGATNISYVQNNYSPKALSRIDIYRQTKNQIALVKGTVM